MLRSHLVTILSLALVAVIVGAVAGALVYWPQPRAVQDRLAALNSSPVATSGLGASTPSPSDAPAALGQGSIRLSLYDLRLTVADPITDLVYGEVKAGSAKVVGFTTQEFIAKYPGCQAGALGTLTRTKASPAPTPRATASPRATPRYTRPGYIKTIDGYDYFYRAPAFTCATDRPGRDAVATAVAALKNQALPTLGP